MNIFFISQKKLTNKYDLPIETIDENITLIDEYHFKLKENVFNFDYLIIEDLSLVSGLEEIGVLFDKEPVINFYCQTSLEHIYFLKNNDIETVVNHLIFGD